MTGANDTVTPNKTVEFQPRVDRVKNMEFEKLRSQKQALKIKEKKGPGF